MAVKRWTVADLAKASGLGRTYIYHLIKMGVLSSVGPSGGRVQFDNDAVEVAKNFARLQKQHGLQPRDLIGLLTGAVRAAGERHMREEVLPRRREIERIQREVVALLDSSEAELRRPSLSVVARTRITELLEKAQRVTALEKELAPYSSGLYQIPEDDPAWEVLDHLFKSRRERNNFLQLLWRTGMLLGIVQRRSGTPQESEEAKR